MMGWNPNIHGRMIRGQGLWDVIELQDGVFMESSPTILKEHTGIGSRKIVRARSQGGLG